MSDDRLQEFYADMLREIAQHDTTRLEVIDTPLIGFPPYYTLTDEFGMTTFYMTHDLMQLYQCSSSDPLLDFSDFID